MKIKNLFYVSLAALSLAACSKDEAPAPQAGVSFKLATVEAVTKADAESPTVEGEDKINNATIYIYKVDGSTTALHTSQDFTSASATINLPAGTYKAVAVVNTSNIASTINTTTLADLQASVIALSDNGKESFVMYGAAGTDVVVTATGDVTAGNNQTIIVKRIVAGLQIGELTFELPQDVAAAYRTAVTGNAVKIISFKIKSSNLNAVLSTGAISGTTAGSVDKLMNASLESTSKMANNILTTLNSTSAERVYSYALATAPELQLCLQFGSEDYSYYNLTLKNQTFEANTMYTLNAKITGTGSSTEEGKDAITSYKLVVENWTTGEPIDGGEVGN